MSLLLDVIQEAQSISATFKSWGLPQDEVMVSEKILPPMSPAELESRASSIPFPLPSELKEVFTSFASTFITEYYWEPRGKWGGRLQMIGGKTFNGGIGISFIGETARGVWESKLGHFPNIPTSLREEIIEESDTLLNVFLTFFGVMCYFSLKVVGEDVRVVWCGPASEVIDRSPFLDCGPLDQFLGEWRKCLFVCDNMWRFLSAVEGFGWKANENSIRIQELFSEADQRYSSS